MNKTCINCKIEFTPKNKENFCRFLCQKAHKNKWVKKYMLKDKSILNLIEKNLQSY